MIFLSFILDGILSTTISYFMPLCTLTSITISSYYKNKDILLKESIFVGILYDVVYMDTLMFNSVIFFILCLFVFYLNSKLNKNLFNIIIENILIIFLYLIITYALFSIYKYLNVDIKMFLYNVVRSFLFNSLYIIILYIIVHKKIKSSYN